MSTFRRRLLANQAQRAARGDIIYPGLVAAWSAEGKTNDDEDRNILKDLTGHGHDITLNNFAFNNQESGYGGYKNYALRTENLVKIVKIDNGINIIRELGYVVKGLKKGDTITVSFDYIAYNIDFELNSYIQVLFNNLYNYTNLIKVTTNKEGHAVRTFTLNNHYNSEDSVVEIDNGDPYIRFDYISFNEGGYFLVKNFTVVKGELDISWFKDYLYPNALVFDGVDDYGVCKNMPILNDFTVIVKRYYLNGEAGIISKGGTYFGNSVFILEGGNSKLTVWSFGNTTFINNYPDYISFMTPDIYNEAYISRGDNKDVTKDITLATIREGENRYWNGAFYSAYLFNHSLPEAEIKAFIRLYIDPLYMLPSEIPENEPIPDCYYDFSLGSNDDENRETIVDLSGNGNDAVAHNFAWSGMSGYNGYTLNFDSWIFESGAGTYENKTSNKFTITSITRTGYAFPYKNLLGYHKIKILVSGITDEVITYGGSIFPKVVLKNGVNDLSGDYGTSTVNNSGFRSDTIIESCNITIELLPEYPGALVLDGVDDYISLDAFDSGFKTMFMLCKPFKTDNVILYDLRPNVSPPHDYALYCDSLLTIGYNSRNINGTYINNLLNTVYTALDLVNKKLLIHVKSELTETHKPIIGANYYSSYPTNMAIYKFLGFKEELNDELILYVINKYNLLEGVDELESSEV